MIYIVTTRSHTYTHRSVARNLRAVRLLSYPQLFLRRRLPRATYVFTDFDRLTFWQREFAASVYRTLRAAGCRVLNDPARALNRLGLLRALERRGINSFKAWAADEADTVDRFPVFLRTASAHRGTLTELIYTAADLTTAVERLIEAGYPQADLVAIEYCNEPVQGDVFRKMSIYRIGDALVTAPSVHQRSWMTKYGEDGVAGDAGYARDLVLLRDNPYREPIRRAFQIAGVDYGRADFAVVRDRVEVYEINSNPHVANVSTHRNGDRAEAIRLGHEGYLAAMRGLDDVSPNSGSITMSWPSDRPRPHRFLRALPGYQWLP